VTHEPLGPEAENVSTPNTSGNKTPGLAQKARREPAGSGVTLRVTEDMINMLLDIILTIYDVASGLGRLNGNPEWWADYHKAVEGLFSSLFGGAKNIRWDEYGIIVPIKYEGVHAFLLLGTEGLLEGKYKLILEDTEEYKSIMHEFEEYGLSTKPIFEVV